jgi:hypothetical protein
VSRAHWTCTRVTGGVKCGAQNPRRAKKCAACLKTRPAKRKAAHLVALDLPYAHYLALNGGIERCGICGAEPGAQRLHRDHDHRTGEPRGLLCFRCNAALRPYMDADWLLDAVVYVQRVIDRRTA